MSKSHLRSLITRILMQLQDMDAEVGKTKLVKLLYLTDIESMRLYRKTLSQLEWKFYHYGPFAFEIDNTLRDLEFDVPQEEFTTRADKRAIRFRIPPHMEEQFEHEFSNGQIGLIDRVVNRWGMEDLNPILDYVYFETEPMKNAKRGELLDFSKVEQADPLSVRSSRGPTEIGAGELADFRRRLQESRRRNTETFSELTPKPRYDRVYEEALMRLDEEERVSLPSSDIELDDEAKQSLRASNE